MSPLVLNGGSDDDSTQPISDDSVISTTARHRGVVASVLGLEPLKNREEKPKDYLSKYLFGCIFSYTTLGVWLWTTVRTIALTAELKCGEGYTAAKSGDPDAIVMGECIDMSTNSLAIAHSITLGLISAVVVNEMGSEQTARHRLSCMVKPILERQQATNASRLQQGFYSVIVSLPAVYVISWTFVGLWCFVGSIRQPDNSGPLFYTGQTWLGVVIKATYSFFGVSEKSAPGSKPAAKPKPTTPPSSNLPAGDAAAAKSEGADEEEYLSKYIFGSIFSLIILGIWVWTTIRSMILDAQLNCSGTYTDAKSGDPDAIAMAKCIDISTNSLAVAHSITFGLISAVVVNQMGSSKTPRHRLSAIVKPILERRQATSAERQATSANRLHQGCYSMIVSLPTVYIISWMFLGLWCFIDSIAHPDNSGSLFYTGQTWLGVVIKATYSFFGVTEEKPSSISALSGDGKKAKPKETAPAAKPLPTIASEPTRAAVRRSWRAEGKMASINGESFHSAVMRHVESL